jgi:hypothetical protein
MTSRRTVIRPELSAWTCQPFCCQRTCTLIPSERPSIPLRHCPESLPDNKKPGVERRAKPPSEWLCAKLDSFLSSARKEPHYRVYSRPSLDLALGRRFFDPTVMPCRLRYPRAICEYTRFHGFVKPRSQIILPPLWVAVQNDDFQQNQIAARQLHQRMRSSVHRPTRRIVGPRFTPMLPKRAGRNGSRSAVFRFSPRS